MIVPYLTPRPAQEAAIQAMVQEPTRAALNGSLMSAGKTLMAVEVMLRIEAKVVLIIGPIGTFESWDRTIHGQSRGDLSLTLIDSKKHGKLAREALDSAVPGIYFMTRERFRMHDWSKHKIDMAIYDEVHAASNRTGAGAKALRSLKPKYKMAMSGTPYGNKFENMWSITRWLWPKLIPRSFWNWVEEWCAVEFDYFAGKKILGERVPGEYVKSLPCYVRIEPPIDQPIYEPRLVQLHPMQRKLYDMIQTDFMAKLGDDYLIADIPVTQRIRMRQITCAVPSIDEEGYVYFADDAESSKLDELEQVFKEYPDRNMFILTDSKRLAVIAARRFAHLGAAEHSGRVAESERKILRQKFRVGEIPYLICVIPTVADGIDGLADSCNTIVWLSYSENGVLNRQSRSRIIGRATGEVLEIDIMAEDTYDIAIVAGLEEQHLDMQATLKVG